MCLPKVSVSSLFLSCLSSDCAVCKLHRNSGKGGHPAPRVAFCLSQRGVPGPASRGFISPRPGSRWFGSGPGVPQQSGGRREGVCGDGRVTVPILLAGARDVHSGPAAVPQGERRQVEAALPADSRRHPPDAGQAAGVSPRRRGAFVSGEESCARLSVKSQQVDFRVVVVGAGRGPGGFASLSGALSGCCHLSLCRRGTQGLVATPGAPEAHGQHAPGCPVPPRRPCPVSPVLRAPIRSLGVRFFLSLIT